MILRRRLLLRLGALAAAPLASWWKQAAAGGRWLAFRPAIFEVTTDSALIWVCNDGEGVIRARYSPEPGGASMLSEALRLTAATGFTGAIRLASLRPDTRYRFHIADADGNTSDGGFAGGSFRTAPAESRDFTFAFSADTHARFRPFSIFDVVAERKPDFFIHLGDTVYADSPRNRFRPELDYYRKKHREIRADPPLQRFFASVPAFAIWDDHEVANDFIGSDPAVQAGRQAFLEFWPVGNYRRDRSILYRSFKWTPACEFFMLDTRQYRDLGESGPGRGRTLLGARQLEWLESGLAASTATFKFLCSSVPFHHGGIDKWGGFKAERRQLIDFIRDKRIRNVVVLSADLHAAADLSDERTGLAEFLIGPLAAPLGSASAPRSKVMAAARPGSYVGDDFNFGLIRMTWRDGQLALRHEVIDTHNRVRYSREIVAAL